MDTNDAINEHYVGRLVIQKKFQTGTVLNLHNGKNYL